ncbi:MAG: J domain-containing protein [Sulfuritalea sp.]|nr:J domain-containing protein [Sulfuritalea sp.]
MLRPLMQHGVGKLEEMFATGKSDAKLLKQLEQELQYRQVPRAVALLAKVQAAMSGGAAVPQAPTVPASPPARATGPISQQPDLWGRPAIPPVSPPAAVRAAAPAVRAQEPLLVARTPASPLAMPLEEAYKVLKATPGATWDSIEQTRRALVNQLHPSRWKPLSAEKRAQAVAEAKRINAAYAALSQTRYSEH